MQDKLAEIIVRSKRLTLIIYSIITVLCAFTISKTVINYDFTAYLSEDTVTRRSLDIMNAEFETTEQISVMFSNLDSEKITELTAWLTDMDGVMRAVYNAEDDSKSVDGIRYDKISLYLDAPDAIAFTEGLNAELTERGDIGEYALSGSAAQTILIEEKILAEIPVAMVIAIAVVIAVLFLTSHSYIEPLIFIIVLLVSIVINMGTNFIFDSISFVTFAVAAILQLALAMDYSIMLLHGFFEIRETGVSDETALRLAIVRSFMPICSSSLTTVAGLVSLMFMSFTIGFDIGIVLSKGILISMLCVFTLMPALILVFKKPLRTTIHKTLPLGGKAVARLAYSGRKIVPVILICAIAAACFLQTKNEYSFTDSTKQSEGVSVTQVFGAGTQLVLLVPGGDSDDDIELQQALVEKLYEIEYEGRKAVSDILSLVTTGAAAVKYYEAEDIAELLNVPKFVANMYLSALNLGSSVRGDVLLANAAAALGDNAQLAEYNELVNFAKQTFVGEHYSRLILTLNVPNQGQAAFDVIDEIRAALAELYPDSETGIAGVLMSSYDIYSAFTGDLTKVNLITIISILLIVLVSFRNVLIPVLLICVIQGAVWINMSISIVIGENVFFMCYLICLAIQMGATIDYGILLTSNYRLQRREKDSRAALTGAIELSLPTIFTSGLILTVAGFAIGHVCTVYYIYSIGRMLARGTLASLVMVLLLLPPLLLLTDKWVIKRENTK